MIDQIFIPTVCRVHNQKTLAGLSVELRRKTTLVVQDWEKDQYPYKDVNYLILPKDINYHTGFRPMSKTRQFIYKHAKDMRYAMIDDDLVFERRNAKYRGLPSNMEKSRTPLSFFEMNDLFDMFDSWLDEERVAVCGCSLVNIPPKKQEVTYNSSVCGAYFIDGPKIKDLVETTDFTVVHSAEDALFILTLLSNGRGTKVSEEYAIDVSHNAPSVFWKTANIETTTKDHLKLAEIFPEYVKILYDPESDIREGGYKGIGRLRFSWTKAYTDWEAKNNTAKVNEFLE